MEGTVFLGRYHRFRGIDRLKKMEYNKPCIVGFDTETCNGPPFCFQLFSKDRPSFTGITAVTEKNVTTKFLECLRKNCKPGIVYVLYCHNLRFDLPSILWQCANRLVERKDNSFEFTFGGWTLKGVFGGPTFCFMNYGEGRNRIEVVIVDTFSWFHSSLDDAAAIVCPDLPKYARPPGLGSIIFNVKDENFAQYAMRDAEIACYIGHEIDSMHKRFDIAQAVSVANMAARIFRKQYIDDTIIRPNDEHMRLAYMAYHGGKNWIIDGAAGAWHTNVAAVDIKSAYPWAMSEAPSFTRDECFSGRRVFSPRKTKHVPPWGVYLCSGVARKADWPVIFDQRFKPIFGKFDRVAIHGFEVNEAIRTHDVKFSSISGYFYDDDKDPQKNTALYRFVTDLYDLKSHAETKVERYLFKTLLNSTYGKFIERRQVEVIDDDGQRRIELRAGPLYHSPLACGITAHTRAHIHRLEVEFEALHTATDGLIIPAREDYSRPFMPREGLGSLALEGEGRVCIARAKVYMFQSESDRWGGYPSRQFPGWWNVKVARHGFMGNSEQLEIFLGGGSHKYKALKVNQLRQSIKRGLITNQFVEETRVLKAPAITRVFNYDTRKRKSLQ